MSQCVTKPVYKGMLKLLLAVVGGLELSLANSGLGGLASAFRLLEISHTHFWSRDLLDSGGLGLGAGTDNNSSDVSRCGSRERLDQVSCDWRRAGHLSSDWRRAGHVTSAQVEGGQQLDSLDSAVSSLPYPGTPPSLAPPPDQDTPQILRDLIMKKKQLLFGRLSSLDSEAEDAASVAASDSGSMTTNPAFQRGGRGFSSIRSAVSDNEMDDSVSQQSLILNKYLLSF